jgi:hypothetical protein
LEEQIEKLNEELAEIIDPHHPGNELFINLLRMNLRMLIQFCFALGMAH